MYAFGDMHAANVEFKGVKFRDCCNSNWRDFLELESFPQVPDAT